MHLTRSARRGTDAEGWITEAVAFWESQTAAKAADTAA